MGIFPVSGTGITETEAVFMNDTTEYIERGKEPQKQCAVFYDFFSVYEEPYDLWCKDNDRNYQDKGCGDGRYKGYVRTPFGPLYIIRPIVLGHKGHTCQSHALHRKE